ncbi:MAG: hypothetical protein E6K75_09345 [Candidatus Eisenbacteria bacterium]|uniref:T9SS type A sorting domain-containing protein n=1 Tax=Eiseniibacteriota bacterium TaxID=2212470 RepID=A0A538SVT5_UNCEI|nr:MAG: hypothetical protein E6K75_09345 [Candidatus Eisenbacteria bacterium]
MRPRFIAVSDFDLDGRPDLAVTLIAGRSEPALLFLPGLGDGTFGAPIPGPFTGFAISVISGDWNVDGKPDLALSDLRNHTFQTFAGQGDGTFASPVSFWSSPEPYGLASDDLNGDGIADLVAGDIGDSTRVFFGNGAGGFPRRTSFAGLPAQYVALGDLNQDGLADIVSGSFGALYVRLNTFASGNTAVEARAFVPKEQKPIFAGSDRDAIEIRLEPVHESYANEQVDLSSLTLSSEGTGSFSQIHSVVPRDVVVSDTDRNGIAEIGITFTRSDLDALFDRVDLTKMVNAELRGSILDGRTFCAGVALNVKNVGPPHAVVFAPNPLNPRSKLTFATTRPGSARAQLFDLQGRLVRTLLDVAVLEAGTHEVFFDGKSSRGQPVSSGVLFYRLTSTEGTFEGRIVVLK